MELKHKSGIYAIQCAHSGYQYIGAAVNLHVRRNTHIKMLRRNSGHNKVLQFAWNVSGESNFCFTVIEFCERALLEEREEYHIKNSKAPLFNLLMESRVPGRLSGSEERKRKEVAKRLHSEGKFGAAAWT